MKPATNWGWARRCKRSARWDEKRQTCIPPCARRGPQLRRCALFPGRRVAAKRRACGGGHGLPSGRSTCGRTIPPFSANLGTVLRELGGDVDQARISLLRAAMAPRASDSHRMRKPNLLASALCQRRDFAAWPSWYCVGALAHEPDNARSGVQSRQMAASRPCARSPEAVREYQRAVALLRPGLSRRAQQSRQCGQKDLGDFSAARAAFDAAPPRSTGLSPRAEQSGLPAAHPGTKRRRRR